MAKVIPLFGGALQISPEKYPQLYPIARNKPDRLELHLVELAKVSYRTQEPSQSQIDSVATILEHDMQFE